VAEEQRALDLRGNLRRRIKNCTINRVWYCVPCRKRYRCSALPPFVCPLCARACERALLGVSVPPPKLRSWDAFWAGYKTEVSLLDTYSRGELRENVKLKILGIRLTAKGSAKIGRIVREA